MVAVREDGSDIREVVEESYIAAALVKGGQLEFSVHGWIIMDVYLPGL